MMEPSQNNLSVAAVTLRTRAIFNLPSEYNFVYVEIRVGHMRKTWTTQKVPVVDGAALLDFWARIPGTGGETSIELKLVPTSARGTPSLFSRVQAKSLHATLHMDSANRMDARLDSLLEETGEPGEQLAGQAGAAACWQQMALSLTASENMLQRIRRAASYASQRLSMARVGSHAPMGTQGPSSTIMAPAANMPSRQPSIMRGAQGMSSISNASHFKEHVTTGHGLAPPLHSRPLRDTSSEVQLTANHAYSAHQLEDATGAAVSGISITLTPASAMDVNLAAVAVPGADKEPIILVEYCTNWLPPDLARLPELDLGEGLSRQMHCYAHGGFMGAAISMLADPEWENILLDSVAETNSYSLSLQVEATQGILGTLDSSQAVAHKRLLMYMTVLENSPVLCAYGLDRMLCTEPALAVSFSADPAIPSAEPTLMDAWWDSDRPEAANDLQGRPSGVTEAVLVPLASSRRTDRRKQHHHQKQGLLWQSFGLPPTMIPAVLLEPQRLMNSPSGLLVNRYGYSPIALEWDLWLDPASPAELAGANVDHGSPMHLVQQAIAMTLRCEGLAQSLGESHNKSAGITPLQWLDHFGTSLNRGSGLKDRNRPLPLHCHASPSDRAMTAYEDGRACPSLESFLEVSVEELTVSYQGEGLGGTGKVDGGYACRLRLLGNAMSRPLLQLGSLEPVGGGQYRASLNGPSTPGAADDVPNPCMYPVHHDVESTLLVVEVYHSKSPNKALGISVISVGALMQRAASSEPSASFGLGSSSSSLRIKFSKGLHTRSPTKKGPVAAAAAAKGDGGEDLASLAQDPHHLQSVYVSPAFDMSSPVQEAGMAREGGFRRAPLTGLFDIAVSELQRSRAIGRRAMGGLRRCRGELRPQEEDDDDSEELLAQEPELEDVLAEFRDNGSQLSLRFQDASTFPVDDTTRPAEVPGQGKVHLSLLLRRTTVLDAAVRMHGLKPAVAQSCLAMLAAPGGLYLDVKSGYSKAQQLKWFASTLAGIGVNVKAICSFVPAQIDFASLKDTQPFGGLHYSRDAAAMTPGGPLGEDAAPVEGAGTESALVSTSASVATTATASVITGEGSGSVKAAPVMPGAAPPSRLPYDAVLFFHGLNGLELACESGRVPPGTCTLFNGASLLLEDASDMLSGDRIAQNLAEVRNGVASSPNGVSSSNRIPDLVDINAWQRYCALLNVFKLFGGIYVQEPDACPASVASLVQLVNNHPGHFPMGFAYGHISAKAVAVAGHKGRGLAAQQLLEEFSSQKRLNGNVCRWIEEGIHLKAGDEVYISWGRRLLNDPGLLYCSSQTLLLQLLADYPPNEAGKLLNIVKGMGGVQLLFLRFFRHYDATSPFTLWELGFNFNHTKPLMRLLRNRGVLSALPVEEKLALSRWLLNCTHGDLAIKMHHFGRADMHKLAKEAFLCLAESCTRDELEQVTQMWGGPGAIRRRLRGWLYFQGLSYEMRLKEVRLHHVYRPDQPAFSHTRYGYVRYERRAHVKPTEWWRISAWDRFPIVAGADGVLVTTDPRHTRDKTWMHKAGWKLFRLLLCLFTCGWNCSLCCVTCSCWCLYCIPIFFYPYCRNKVLPLAIAIALVGMMWVILIFAMIAIAIYEGAIACSPHLQTLVECSLTAYYVLPMFDNSTNSTSQGQNSSVPVFGGGRRFGL